MAQTLTGVHFIDDTGTMQVNGSSHVMGGTNIVCTFSSGPDDIGCLTQTVIWSTPTVCVLSVTSGTIVWDPTCHPNNHTQFPAGSFDAWAIVHVVVGAFSDTAQVLVQDGYLFTQCSISGGIATFTVSATGLPAGGFSPGLFLALQGMTGPCAGLNGVHGVTQSGTSGTTLTFTTALGNVATTSETGYVSDLFTQWSTPDEGWYQDDQTGAFYNPYIQPGTTFTIGMGFTQDGGGSANPFPFCNWLSSNPSVETVDRNGIVTRWS